MMDLQLHTTRGMPSSLRDTTDILNSIFEDNTNLVERYTINILTLITEKKRHQSLRENMTIITDLGLMEIIVQDRSCKNKFLNMIKINN